MNDLDTARLGAAVREKRENLGMSQVKAAELAGVGRTTLHRLELGPEARDEAARKRPYADTLAKVLATLRFTETEAREAISDALYADEVVRRMPRHAPGDGVAEYARARRGTYARGSVPDLVLLHPDGSVAVVEFKSAAEDVIVDRLDEIAKAMRDIGYMVTVPAA